MINSSSEWFGPRGKLPNTVIEAPTSTAPIRFIESDHVNIIKAREGIISSYTNPYASEILDAQHRDLASKDFLEDNAVITGLKKDQKEDSGYRVSSLGFGRSVPIAYGEIPYGQTIGGVVIQKGGGISGWKRNSLSEENDSIGFLEKKDAENEIKESNALIKEGFRSSLVLGYVELNPEWILSKIQDDSMKRRVQKSLDIIKEHGDVPVAMFRVDGTAERLALGGEYVFSDQRFRGELARGSRLLLSEAKMKNSLADAYLDSLGEEKNATLTVLSKLEKREQLNDEEASQYFRFYMTMVAHNAIALEKLNSRNSNEIHFPFSFWGYGKDIDLAFLAKDYDDSEPDIRLENIKPSYYKYMLEAGKRFVNLMKKSKIITNKFDDQNIWNNFTELVNKSISKTKYQ